MAILHLGANRILGQYGAMPDSLGSSADGTLVSDPAQDTTPTPPSGLGSSSFYFDGNDAIDIDGAVDFSTTVGSVSLWFYNDGSSESKVILGIGDENANSQMIVETKTNGIMTKVRHNSGTYWEIRRNSSNNGGALSTGWHHLVVSQDGTAVKVYVDGTYINTDWNDETDKSKWILSELDTCMIGCINKNSLGNRDFFTGNCMEIGFWNVALTSTQVSSLYGNGGSTAKKANTESTGLRAYYPLSGTTVTNDAVATDEKATLLTGGYGSDTTLHVNNNTGNAYHIATSSSFEANGVFVNSSANDALVDAEIQSVSFYLKGSSLTGTITCSVYNADGSLIGAIGTYDISGLTTSWQKITFSGTDRVLPEDGFIQFHGFGSSAIKINGIATTGTVFEACRTASLNGTPVKLNEGVNCEIVYKPVASLLEENTIFIEKDTKKQYFLQDNVWEGSLPDFVDYFSTYADQTSANTSWSPASNVAGRRVNITNDNLELKNDSGTTNYAVAYDLGAGLVSDTKWVLRFSADVTLSSGTNNWCYIGLFNSDESVGGGTNQNMIAISFQNDGTNTKFWSIAGVGKNVNAGSGDYFNASSNGTLTSTKYYIQLSRTSATSMDIKIYSDSTYSTLHTSMTASGSSISFGDLRYIKFVNNTTSGSGSIDIVMDDVKFVNGVTSI